MSRIEHKTGSVVLIPNGTTSLSRFNVTDANN